MTRPELRIDDQGAPRGGRGALPGATDPVPLPAAPAHAAEAAARDRVQDIHHALDYE